MKTDKEDMLKTYNEFKALCLEKGYEFKFDGIQEYINAEYAVLNFWKSSSKEKHSITELADGQDILTTLDKLYHKGIDNLIKYG